MTCPDCHRLRMQLYESQRLTLRTADRLADAAECLGHLAERKGPPAVTPELDTEEFLAILRTRYPWLTNDKLAAVLECQSARLRGEVVRRANAGKPTRGTTENKSL